MSVKNVASRRILKKKIFASNIRKPKPATLTPSFDERFLAEEAGEAFEDRGGHVRVCGGAGAGLEEEVAVLLKKVLIDGAAAVGEEFLLVGPGGVIDKRVDL